MVCEGKLGMKRARWLVARWAGRVWRLLWPDRNPLRRRLDRIERLVLGGLVVGAIVAAPFAATASSHWAYVGAREAAREQLQTRHQTRPVLLAPPAGAMSGYTVNSLLPGRAQWHADVCGSPSIRATFQPRLAISAATDTARVVLPTPPLRCATAMI